MEAAWYEEGTGELAPKTEHLSSGFIILVDTNNKATNFTSSYEQFLREESNTLDTESLSRLSLGYGWDKLTAEQKFERLKEKKISYKNEAEDLHKTNNNGQALIWLINNTNDTVSVPMQDASYICVLQAKTKPGKWLPIQYWQFSRCGNSYYSKDFAPGMANCFTVSLPNRGNYKTKLRFKLLGTGTFYYSNEFDGKIDDCMFVEDLTNTSEMGYKPFPHYKLDSLRAIAVHSD